MAGNIYRDGWGSLARQGVLSPHRQTLCGIMRFEELPPSLMERLGLEDEVELVRQHVLFEASEFGRVSRNTSLSSAGRVVMGVLAPPSPVFLLLVVWLVLLVIRCVMVRASAARQVRRHAKVL